MYYRKHCTLIQTFFFSYFQSKKNFSNLFIQSFEINLHKRRFKVPSSCLNGCLKKWALLDWKVPEFISVVGIAYETACYLAAIAAFNEITNANFCESFRGICMVSRRNWMETTRLNANSWEVLSGPTFSEFYNMISTNSQLAN